jgi:FemAB-related protein (PEP-CTERM system-associated)
VIELLPPSGGAEWDDYVDRRPDSTCHHLFGWSRVAARAYRIRSRMLVSRKSGGAAIRGVLPLFLVRRPLHHYLTSGLFGAYGPLLGDDPEVLLELIAAAKGLTAECGAAYLHLKATGPAPPEAAGLARQSLWVVASLPLDLDPLVVWRRFDDKMRSTIRGAQKNGFLVREGPGELDAFYDVLAENMHRKGSPIYGHRFMRAVLEELAERAGVLTLWRDGRPVSGALTLVHHGVCTVPFASSRAAYFSLRPNNYLYWELIERAARAGLRTFDFGSSLVGSSALAFKLGWGATTEPITSLVYTDKDGAPPRLDASAKGLRAGVSFWKHLPRSLADALGPRVARYML